MVIRRVEAPVREEELAASRPACPAPTIITSNWWDEREGPGREGSVEEVVANRRRCWRREEPVVEEAARLAPRRSMVSSVRIALFGGERWVYDGEVGVV